MDNSIEVISVETAGLFRNKQRVVFRAKEACKLSGYPLGWGDSWINKGNQEILTLPKSKYHFQQGQTLTFQRLVDLKWDNHAFGFGEWQVAGGV